MDTVSGSATAKALTTAITNSIGSTAAQIQMNLNTAYGGSFKMTADQISNVFDILIESYIKTAQGSGVGYSDELVALTSVACNGLYGPGLSAALALTDPYEARAEAWYQIRYKHKNQLHKRRYVEAAFFGLYDNPSGTVGTDEFLVIYRMYTKHAKEALAHDACLHS